MKLMSNWPLWFALSINGIDCLRANAGRVLEIKDGGWTPIVIKIAPRYIGTGSFLPSEGPEKYFLQEWDKISNVITSAPLVIENHLRKVHQAISGVNKEKIKDTNEKVSSGKSEAFTEAKVVNILDTYKDDFNAKSSLASQSFVISSTPPHDVVPTTLRPEVSYDIPLISYSDHATNKSDATAYYRRLNDYYGTQTRRLKFESELNENIDSTSSDHENSKSNNLNSERNITEETKSESSSEKNLEQFGSPFSFVIKRDASTNINNSYEKNKTNISDEVNHQLQAKTHNNAPVFGNSQVKIDNKASSVFTDKQNLKSDARQKKTIFQDFVETFLTNFKEKNLNNSDIMPNYRKSRSKRRHYSSKQNYGVFNEPPLFTGNIGYNSLNHLPVDPVLAVMLTRYGHYVPGFSGRNVDYRNIYAYLASNNMHNNKPFGSYKFYSDTDA